MNGIQAGLLGRESRARVRAVVSLARQAQARSWATKTALADRGSLSKGPSLAQARRCELDLVGSRIPRSNRPHNDTLGCALLVKA